ncbi:MAG: hypothetical protein OEZ06_02350 [Myxococcales bacterium]|nr:hypothetical protein [Myxococcales bacterium]
MFRALTTLAAACLLLASCSALVSPDKQDLGPAPMACIPSSVNTCPCPGGGSGQQICNNGGSYDDCVCAALVPVPVPQPGVGQAGAPGGGP